MVLLPSNIVSIVPYSQRGNAKSHSADSEQISYHRVFLLNTQKYLQAMNLLNLFVCYFFILTLLTFLEVRHCQLFTIICPVGIQIQHRVYII